MQKIKIGNYTIAIRDNQPDVVVIQNGDREYDAIEVTVKELEQVIKQFYEVNQ